MSNIIRSDVVSSYFDCPLKFYKITHENCKVDLDIHQSSLTQDYRTKFEHKKNIKSNFDIDSNYDDTEILIGGTFIAKGIKFKIDYVKNLVKNGKHSIYPIIIINSTKIPKHIINNANLIISLFGCLYDGDIERILVLKSNLRLSKVPLINTSKDIETILLNIENITSKPPIKINTHCKICQFQDSCKRTAIKDDNLSILPEINDKIIKNYNNRGIFTVNQLSYKFRARKDHQRKDSIAYILPMRAYAIRENKVIVNEAVEFPDSLVDIFLDIEGIPKENSNYLIGCIIKKGHRTYTKHFWANSLDDEILMIKRFLDYICRFNFITIYHYGNYEINYFKKIIKLLDDDYKDKLNKIISSSFNLLSIFRSKIIFPCYTNSLKDIARHLNYEWTSKVKNGKDSISSRALWELNNSNKLKSDLILYNNNDCHALMVVYLYIKSIIHNINSGNRKFNEEYITNDDISKQIDFGYTKYIRNGYASSEIKEVMNYAYFDYLKERFSLREREYNKIKHGAKTIDNKVDFYDFVDHVKYSRKSKCPSCHSKRVLKKANGLSKTILDLKIENGFVQRWVTQFKTKKYKCQDCQLVFIPQSYPASRARIGNTIKIWMVYQYIYNRLSLSQINNNLRDFYDIHLSSATIFTFKRHVANILREVVLKDLKELTRGKVLYVDETPFKLASGTYYCWIFTDGFRSVSIMRKDRKSEFLLELLKEFRGVLVTDFFSGYDSINCKKQKCLIHFMRDINNDLLKNPFDDELIKICNIISGTLKGIINIAECYGYNKEHLSIGKKEVEIAINEIKSMNINSEVAEKYRTRFIRYQSCFFEFINHDNVLWHNTYAEHAIKLLSKHRNKNIKSFRYNHLADYAILMSIYQSCHFQGISFLNYMLSHARCKKKSRSKYTELAKLL